MGEYSASRRRVLKATGGVSLLGMSGLAGCSEEEPSNGGNGGDGNGDETVRLRYAAGDQTSAAFQTAIPWGEQIRRTSDLDIDLDVQTTGGLDANVRGVGNNEFDMGATTAPNFQAASLGVQPFDEEYDINVLFTNMVYPFPIAFTTTSRDIDYIEDIEGRTVATGRPGSAAHTYFEVYCHVNGIDLDSMTIERIGGDDMYRQLDSGRLDAVLTAGVNTVLGASTQQWLQRADDAKLVVPRTEEHIERLSNAGQYMDALPYEQAGILFDFPLAQFEHAHENSAVADEDSYLSVAGTNTQFATTDMSDEIAYEITKVALEQAEALADATALWGGFAGDIDFYATAIAQADAEAAPVLPGAKEAMEEFGVWDDDLPVADR